MATVGYGDFSVKPTIIAYGKDRWSVKNVLLFVFGTWRSAMGLRYRTVRLVWSTGRIPFTAAQPELWDVGQFPSPDINPDDQRPRDR
jgi:hypothetical protein